MCEDCHDTVVDTLNPDGPMETIIIEMPAFLFYDHLCQAFRTAIRKQPKNFRWVLLPFTIDALRVLRQHVLATVLYASMPEPVQTRGMRGGSRRSWKLLIADTLSFKLIIGNLFQPAATVNGTSVLYDENALTAWVPPLMITVTTGKDSNSMWQCAFDMSSGRITEHGFDFTRKTLRTTNVADLATKQRYLANAVFDIQAWRVALNQTVPLLQAVPVLDHALLLKASQHL
jgi:hypothetical protein